MMATADDLTYEARLTLITQERERVRQILLAHEFRPRQAGEPIRFGCLQKDWEGSDPYWYSQHLLEVANLK